MKLVAATYNGNSFVPDEPLALPANTRVLVSIPDAKAQPVKSTTVDDLARLANYSGTRKSLEEIDEGIRLGAEEAAKWCR